MTRKSHRFLYYALIRFALLLSYLVPKRVCYFLARRLGDGMFRHWKRERDKIERHLEFAYGKSLAPERKQEIVRGVFTHVALIAAEMMTMYRTSDERLNELVVMDEADRSRMAELLKQNQGVVIATGHMGNWEVLGRFLNYNFCTRSRPLHVIAKRIYFKLYNDLFVQYREKFGVATIYRDDSLMKIVRHLKDGGMIGVLTDQDIPSVPGIFVDFFGHPAYTVDIPAKLAKLTGAAIVPIFLIREGRGYRILLGEFLLPDKGKRDSEEIQELTQSLATIMEKFIRQYPEQWVWMHRRWKTQPPLLQQQPSEERK